LATALLLDKDGHTISIYERFTEPSPVGSGLILQPTGLAVLGAMGLRQAVEGLGSRIDRMIGDASPGGRGVLDVDYRALGLGHYGVAVHRSVLFGTLFSAARAAGIEIIHGSTIAATRLSNGVHPDSISIQDSTGLGHGPFDLIVDASGTNSLIRASSPKGAAVRWLSYGALWTNVDWPQAEFDARHLTQRYVGAHTMIGVLPIGRREERGSDQAAFFYSIKLNDYQAWRSAGIDNWKAHVLSIWPATAPILDRITDADQFTLARYGHHTLATPYGDRLALIGDAAHATSPQLGQGANMALLDAWALRQALRSESNLGAALAQYGRLRRWHVRLFQWASLGLTGFYQSDSATLALIRDRCFNPLTKLPVSRRIVAGLISGLLGDPLSKLALKSTDVTSSRNSDA